MSSILITRCVVCGEITQGTPYCEEHEPLSARLVIVAILAAAAAVALAVFSRG